MKIPVSDENYMEAILILQKQMGESAVYTVDLARHMGFSKPSISHAAGVLWDGRFLTGDKDGLHLTEEERKIAEKNYERYQFFMEQFIAMGVNETTTERDACRIEHVISDESFQKLQNYFTKTK